MVSLVHFIGKGAQSNLKLQLISNRIEGHFLLSYPNAAFVLVTVVAITDTAVKSFYINCFYIGRTKSHTRKGEEELFSQVCIIIAF